LMGDFHALNQSQKGHLRVLRLLPKTQKKVLFVEFLKRQDQKFLDLYLKEELSEQEFLDKVQWEQSWGFPWKSYKPLLVWAKKHRVPVVAIDRALKFHGDQSLALRDQFAAQVIFETLVANPDHLGIVIIGDYHISKNHLPKRLLEKFGNLKIVRIFQNSETIFLKLLELGKEFEIDVVRFNRWDYCLVSVAPWVKWHALLLHYEETIEGDHEIVYKVSEEVHRFYGMLKHDLNTFDLDDDFHVTTITDNKFFNQLDSLLNASERSGIRELIEIGGGFYIPQLKTAFVSKLSLNHVAEVASTIWHFKITKTGWESFMSEDYFYELVWIFVVQYFGSKLINPKRKMATILDLKKDLRDQKSGSDYYPWVIKIKQEEELWISGIKKRLSLYRKIPGKKRVRVAREIGFMTGEKLYFLYRKRWLSSQDLMMYLQAPISTWKETYLQVIRKLDERPDPYPSKYQRV
ncbi:MAG: ChaN family lipoprotein, partial [Bdellovibrionaceae bacterium]|nr:ChaN family lipoprotein [Pseudobdellovibrionaceae bacterium]MDW8191265.1 ChaN family lipoprotein [Pseudobdellovibrionaceae bacterium]